MKNQQPTIKGIIEAVIPLIESRIEQGDYQLDLGVSGSIPRAIFEDYKVYLCDAITSNTFYTYIMDVKYSFNLSEKAYHKLCFEIQEMKKHQVA